MLLKLKRGKGVYASSGRMIAWFDNPDEAYIFISETLNNDLVVRDAIIIVEEGGIK